MLPTPAPEPQLWTVCFTQHTSRNQRCRQAFVVLATTEAEAVDRAKRSADARRTIDRTDAYACGTTVCLHA